MATAVLIDLSNYDSLLVQSTESRSGTPDGNVYFNKVTGAHEFITKQELAQVDLGSGLEDNPLDEVLGIKLEAAYAFENQERASDEDLRKYDRWLEGNFKFAGAYNYINSRKPSTDADRAIIRGSGWSEYASDGGIDRIYFGNKGLSNIELTSQPYYQLSLGGAPTSYSKSGQIDEAVQVYGNTGNVPADATAGDFDTRSYEAVSVRTFGNNYDRKETPDLGITELGGYSTGFALNESSHLTTGNFTLADVYGGAQVSPWTGLTLESKDTPVTISGFNESDGDFTWVVNNTASANLNEIIAYLDALAQTDDDIDANASNTINGKRVNTWYSYDAQSRILTRSGAPDGKGLYFYNVPTADEQLVVFTDDAGNTKTMPFMVGIEINIGSTAKADALGWFHMFGASAYNTSGAITAKDSSGADIKGMASEANGANKINKVFDYDGDVVLGSAGTDKNCVFLCEGDGGATQAKTLFTITRSTTIAFSCVPGVENNV